MGSAERPDRDGGEFLYLPPIDVKHAKNFMTIIISKNGQNAQKIDKSDFARESDVQEYINQNPESIPIYELKEDKKLFVAKREFATNAGPIDALAVDKDGDIYIVETKLYKNPDKRTVVAQALDYGAALWKHLNDFDDFLITLDSETQKRFNQSFPEKLQEFYGIEDEQVSILLDALKRNLNEGNIKFVILMDSIDERLKDLILYVNQNSQFDIYAVQLEYYKFETYEIMIPKIFGVEVKKNIKTYSSSQRRKWDEQSMIADAKQKLGQKEQDAFMVMYHFCKTNADKINFGTGSYATFSPIFNKLSHKSLFTLGTDNRLSFNFEWIAKDNKRSAELFKQKLESLGYSFPDNFLEIRPSVMGSEWSDKSTDIIRILKEMMR